MVAWPGGLSFMS